MTDYHDLTQLYLHEYRDAIEGFRDLWMSIDEEKRMEVMRFMQQVTYGESLIETVRRN